MTAGPYPGRSRPGLWKFLPALARPGLRERRGGGVVLSRSEEPAAFPAFRKTPLGVRAAGECSCQQLPYEQSAAIQSSLDVSVPANRAGFQSLGKVFVEGC
ncbi:unnamed protein product [Coccothraustes coccothraustes]